MPVRVWHLLANSDQLILYYWQPAMARQTIPDYWDLRLRVIVVTHGPAYCQSSQQMMPYYMQLNNKFRSTPVFPSSPVPYRETHRRLSMESFVKSGEGPCPITYLPYEVPHPSDQLYIARSHPPQSLPCHVTKYIDYVPSYCHRHSQLH